MNNDELCTSLTKTVGCLSLILNFNDYLKEKSRKSQPISYLHQNKKTPEC